MIALHFGAGNIGRGFVGQLLHDSGYQVRYIDINEEVIDLLNQEDSYEIHYANDTKDVFTITGTKGYHITKQEEQILTDFVEAEIVTTALGVSILPHIAGLMAKGLERRFSVNQKPINIIACENAINATDILKEEIAKHFKGNLDELPVGFPNSAVDRIVPNQDTKGSLNVLVEPYHEWVIEEPKLVGNHTYIENAKYVADLQPFIERKLFTVNTGHAICAYFGSMYGKETIQEVLKDEALRKMVHDALLETGDLLVNKYDINREEHVQYIESILGRFENENLTDEVDRVGRSPIRKVGNKDRLIRPAIEYLSYVGQAPKALLKGIAAAYSYKNDKDHEAIEIQTSIQEKGIVATISQYSEIPAQWAITKDVLHHYRELNKREDVG